MLELRGGIDEKKKLVGVAIRVLLALFFAAWLDVVLAGNGIPNRSRIGNA